MNSKISCISTSFKKEISILNHIAKKLHARPISLNCLSKKDHIINTVLVVDLTFEFWASSLKNVEFRDSINHVLCFCNDKEVFFHKIILPPKTLKWVMEYFQQRYKPWGPDSWPDLQQLPQESQQDRSYPTECCEAV